MTRYVAEVKSIPHIRAETELKIDTACKRFGAYEVRKAAIRQMEGERDALWTVGMHHQYCCEDVMFISDRAFDRMTNEEIHHESCLNLGIEYWPLNNE